MPLSISRQAPSNPTTSGLTISRNGSTQFTNNTPTPTSTTTPDYTGSTVPIKPISTQKNLWQDLSDFFTKVGDQFNKALDTKPQPSKITKAIYDSPLMSWNQSQSAKNIRAGTEPQFTPRESIREGLKNVDPRLGMTLNKIPTITQAVKGGIAGLGIGSGLQAVIGDTKEQIIQNAPMNFLFGAAFGGTQVKPLTPTQQTKGVLSVFNFLKESKLYDQIKSSPDATKNKVTQQIIDRYSLPGNISFLPKVVKSEVFKNEPGSIQSFIKKVGIEPTTWNGAVLKNEELALETVKLLNIIDEPYWPKLRSSIESQQKNIKPKVDKSFQDVTVKPDGQEITQTQVTQKTQTEQNIFIQKEGVKSPKSKSIETEGQIPQTSLTKNQKIEEAKPPTPKEVEPSITKQKVATLKDASQIKKAINKTSQEIRQLTDELQAKAEANKIQTEGLNMQNLAQLKRIVARSEKFQAGDIETIRASKTGKLMDQVLENIKEFNPRYADLSDEELLRLALSMPTKGETIFRKTPEVRQLEARAKTLREYFKALDQKYKGLTEKEKEGMFKDWEDVVVAQENLEKVVGIRPGSLPVGEDKLKLSRLEARITKQLDQAPEEVKNLSTYSQMNKKDQIAKAAAYVNANTDQALRVLSGEINPPEGLLRNSIFVAMQNLAKGDVELARKLASLTSSRFGQEISILTEIDPYSPVKIASEIYNIKEEAFKARYGGRSSKEVFKSIAQNGRKHIKDPSRSEWKDLINNIKCK